MRKTMWIIVFYLACVYLFVTLIMCASSNAMDCKEFVAASWCDHESALKESATASRIKRTEFWRWPEADDGRSPTIVNLTQIQFELTPTIEYESYVDWDHRKTVVDTIFNLQKKVPDIFVVGRFHTVWVTVRKLDSMYAATRFDSYTGRTAILLDPIFFSVAKGMQESIIVHEVVHAKLFWQGINADAPCGSAYHERLAYGAELFLSSKINPGVGMRAEIESRYWDYSKDYKAYCFDSTK